MATAPLILVAAPPKSTPFFDTQGRIQQVWIAWLGSIMTAAATLKASIASASSAALQAASNLSDLENLATARGNLGLGTAATHAVGDFDAAGSAAAAQAAAIAASDALGSAAAAQAAAIAASDPVGSAAAAQAAAIAASDPVGSAAGVSVLAAKLAGGNTFAGIQEFTGAVLINSAPPTLSTDPGTAGELTWDANYLYLCVAANSWKRSALATF